MENFSDTTVFRYKMNMFVELVCVVSLVTDDDEIEIQNSQNNRRNGTKKKYTNKNKEQRNLC